MSEGWVWSIEGLLQELVLCGVIEITEWGDVELYLKRLGFSLDTKVEKSE